VAIIVKAHTCAQSDGVDPTGSSYGFRPGRDAHQALQAAQHIRELLKGARGRGRTPTLQALNPLLRGWAAYCKLAETKSALDELHGWARQKLRCLLWRQWKPPHTRARNLMTAERAEARAFRSTFNQRGPWWNSGASHMNQAFPKSFFDRVALVSLLDTV